jgi:ribose transport system substrate-binding protein
VLVSVEEEATVHVTRFIPRSLVVAALTAVVLAACGGGRSNDASEGGADETAAQDQQSSEQEASGTIGLSMHFLADDYAQVFADTVESTATDLGLEVRSASADGDPQKQLSDIASFVGEGVDALIVIPIDEAAIVPALQSTADAGIPILSASPVPGAEDIIASVVGPSDFENGRAACEEMVAAMEEAGAAMDVAISTASVQLYRIEQREEGCRAALDEAGATVVATERGLSPEEGVANAQNLLSAHSELSGIFASFSSLVVGAGNALKQANRTDVAVSGIDADSAVVQLIVEGYVTSVAAQFPREQAELITQAAADVLAGEEVDADQQDLLPTRTVNDANAEERHEEIWGEPLPSQ